MNESWNEVLKNDLAEEKVGEPENLNTLVRDLTQGGFNKAIDQVLEIINKDS